MKKILYLAMLIFISGTAMQAQVVKERFSDKEQKEEPKEEEEKEERQPSPPSDRSPIWDRLVWGGNLSLTFGSNSFIYLAPSVGYKVTDDFVAGVGFIYQYLRVNQVYNLTTQSFQSADAESTVYGPQVFANYFIKDLAFVSTQFEMLNHDLPLYDPIRAEVIFENRWTPVWFVGAGITKSLGRKGFVQLGIRVNLLHDFDSPYANSWTPVLGFFF